MSGWIDFVKTYAKENNIKYKEALKQASASYKGNKQAIKEVPKTKAIAEIQKVKKSKTPVEPVVEVPITEPIKKVKAKKAEPKI